MPKIVDVGFSFFKLQKIRQVMHTSMRFDVFCRDHLFWYTPAS